MRVYIQADLDQSRTGPPIPYQPELDLTEGPHLSYALQWFAFAVLTVSGFAFYVRRQESREMK
jgi:surfeit locus 1 family protein